VVLVESANATDSVKSVVATDISCLKGAKQAGKKVKIVGEVELDVFCPASTDTNCPKRAKPLGEKIQITD
jgi:hypothetical protein